MKSSQHHCFQQLRQKCVAHKIMKRFDVTMFSHPQSFCENKYNIVANIHCRINMKAQLPQWAQFAHVWYLLLQNIYYSLWNESLAECSCNENTAIVSKRIQLWIISRCDVLRSFVAMLWSLFTLWIHVTFVSQHFTTSCAWSSNGTKQNTEDVSMYLLNE